MATNLAPDINPLAERLADDYADQVQRTANLVDALARAPAFITEENFDRAGAFVRQLREHTKLLNATREQEKKDFLEAGRTVDGFFRKLAEQLDKAAATMEARIRTYLQAKERAERELREAEAKRQREEAARLAEEARAREAELEAARLAAMDVEKIRDPEAEEIALQSAIAAEQQAQDAAQAALEAKRHAGASVTDMARTRSAIAGTATLVSKLSFEITDQTAAVIHLASYFTAEDVEKAARTFAREYRGDQKATLVKEQPVAGIRFYIETAARVV